MKMTIAIDSLGKYSEFFQGLRDSVPICVAFSMLFFSLGVLCHKQGLDMVQAGIMTASIFSAPLQVALLQLLNSNLTLLAIVIATLLVNFRFLIMSITLVKYINYKNWLYIIPSIFLISASVFTVSYVYFVKNPSKRTLSYFVGVGLSSYLIACLFTLAGYFFVEKFDSTYFAYLFSMALPIHFTALTARLWPKYKLVISTLLGFAIIPVLHQANQGLILIIGPIVIGGLLTIVDLIKERRHG